MNGRRIYLFDNIKGILIFLVVFAHLLECAGLTGSYLYRVIYSFHMPLFVFVSGFFARFDLKKILRTLVWPYLLFQVIFLLFDGFILHPGTFRLQFVTPYWILWYLFALIVWYLLAGLLDTGRPVLQLVIIAGFTAAAVLAGFSGKIGYPLSLSRILVFASFFFAGFYLSKHRAVVNRLTENSRKADELLARYPNLKGVQTGFRLSFAAALYTVIAVVLCLALIWRLPQITPRVLWGSYGYAATGTGPVIRLVVMGIAALWTAVALVLVPDRKIPAVSTAGSNSLSVYLLHVFICRLLLKFRLLSGFSPLPAVFICLALAAGIVLLLGNRAVGRGFSRLLFFGKAGGR